MLEVLKGPNMNRSHIQIMCQTECQFFDEQTVLAPVQPFTGNFIFTRNPIVIKSPTTLQKLHMLSNRLESSRIVYPKGIDLFQHHNV